MQTWRSWAGIAAAVLLLAVEVPVMVRAVQMQKTRTTRVLPPFQVKVFEPVVRTQDPRGVSLYQTDRILEIDGRPVRNRADIEDGLRAAEPRWMVRLKVRHYPEDGEELEEEALGMFAPQDRYDNGFYAGLWSTAWFGMVVWPGVCLLLAAAVWASNGESGRAWLVGLALAGMGHLHWMLVTPYAWEDPWRTLFVLYDAAVASSIPFCLVAVGYSLPRAIQLVGAGWVFFNVAVRLAERVSYGLLAPIVWMDGWIGTGTYLLIMVAGVALSIRWIRGKEKALRWGSWAFLGGLGFLFIFLPRVTGDYVGVITFQPVVWLCYTASLGLPLGIAVFGAEREKRLDLAAVQLPACGSVRELFAAAKGVAEKELGVQLVALYGPAGGELRVLAAAVEGHEWPPLAPGGKPEDGILQWSPMPEGVGFLGTFGEEGTSGEGLARLAEAVSVQIDQLSRTPST